MVKIDKPRLPKCRMAKWFESQFGDSPGYGGNLGIGLGYNAKDKRFGSSITWTYKDAVKTNSNSGANNDGSIEFYATGV